MRLGRQRITPQPLSYARRDKRICVEALRPLGLSDLEADLAHELDGVALLHDTRTHRVVEVQGAIDHLIFEVHVRRTIPERSDDVRQREVVRGDEADRVTFEERPNHRIGADAPIV